MTKLSGRRPPPSLPHLPRVAYLTGVWGSGYYVQMGQRRVPRAALPEWGGVWGVCGSSHFTSSTLSPRSVLG